MNSRIYRHYIPPLSDYKKIILDEILKGLPLPHLPRPTLPGLPRFSRRIRPSQIMYGRAAPTFYRRGRRVTGPTAAARGRARSRARVGGTRIGRNTAPVPRRLGLYRSMQEGTKRTMLFGTVNQAITINTGSVEAENFYQLYLNSTVDPFGTLGAVQLGGYTAASNSYSIYRVDAYKIIIRVLQTSAQPFEVLYRHTDNVTSEDTRTELSHDPETIHRYAAYAGVGPAGGVVIRSGGSIRRIQGATWSDQDSQAAFGSSPSNACYGNLALHGLPNSAGAFPVTTLNLCITLVQYVTLMQPKPAA